MRGIDGRHFYSIQNRNQDRPFYAELPTLPTFPTLMKRINKQESWAEIREVMREKEKERLGRGYERRGRAVDGGGHSEYGRRVGEGETVSIVLYAVCSMLYAMQC
jgi:hypothetical protein